MKSDTITYDATIEENARSSGWYLSARDAFVLGIVKKITNSDLPKKILDAGCGTGGVISELGQGGILTVGNDMSIESLKIGKKNGRIINGVQASITYLPFKDGIFDVTICSEVLEHVDNDLSALKELGRVTKNKIVITVPAHKYFWTDSDEILLHKRRYSKIELLTLFKNSGLRTVKLKPYGAIPAFLVILYKLFKSRKSKIDKQKNELPLGLRFKIPTNVENILKKLFLFDLWLSGKGLIIWGHSWWACIEVTEKSVNKI